VQQAMAGNSSSFTPVKTQEPCAYLEEDDAHQKRLQRCCRRQLPRLQRTTTSCRHCHLKTNLGLQCSEIDLMKPVTSRQTCRPGLSPY
jgi:hypothetical protein